MKCASRFTVAALCVAQLVVAGCASGGGGLSELFEKLFGGAAPADVLASFTSFGDTAFSALDDALGGGGGENGGWSGDEGYEGGGISDLGGGDGGQGGSIVKIATIHNPEPGSLALFGGGLAGTAVLARRRRRKHSKRSKA